MEVMNEKKLPGGEPFRLHHWCSPEPIPARFVRYMAASFGYEKYRESLCDIAYWRLYSRESMNGKFAPEVIDHWFFAEVDGELAARMWFAYSAKSGIGNFGHVETEPEYRKRGIMNEMLPPCMETVRRSPVRMLFCMTGNPVAIRGYEKVGFRLIYGGKSGPLVFAPSEDYEAVSRRAFAGTGMAKIRTGGIGDQFECDKFLAYSESVYPGHRHLRRGPAIWIYEFRSAYQEMCSGNGCVMVAENRQGTIVGYAYALNIMGNPLLDFTVHGDYAADAAKLLQAAVAEYRRKFSGPLFFYAASADCEKIGIAVGAGAVECAVLPGALPDNEALKIFRF